MRSFTKSQLWGQNTIRSMHRDHLVGNQYFATFFVFCTKSVMLCPRFIPEAVFYTQSVMFSPCFIPASAFYTQSVVRSPQSLFYTDRLLFDEQRFRVHFFTKEIQDWILKSERIQK